MIMMMRYALIVLALLITATASAQTDQADQAVLDLLTVPPEQLPPSCTLMPASRTSQSAFLPLASNPAVIRSQPTLAFMTAFFGAWLDTNLLTAETGYAAIYQDTGAEIGVYVVRLDRVPAAPEVEDQRPNSATSHLVVKGDLAILVWVDRGDGATTTCFDIIRQAIDGTPLE